MKKGRLVAGILTAIGICLLLLLLLLAHDAAAPSRLRACVHCVEIGMTQAEVEAMFGRRANIVLPLSDGSDLNEWLARDNDNRADVVLQGGQVVAKRWVRSDETLMEKIQNRLGMPWWGGEDEDDLVEIREKAKAAIPTTFKNDEPSIEVSFPGKPTVKIHADGKQVTLEPVGGRTSYFLDINKLPAQVPVIDDPVLAKKLLDDSVESLVQSMKGVKLVSEKDFLSCGKYPARAVDLEIPGQSSYRWHFVLTPVYSYQLVVGGTKEFIASDDAAKFLNSLKLPE